MRGEPCKRGVKADEEAEIRLQICPALHYLFNFFSVFPLSNLVFVSLNRHVLYCISVPSINMCVVYRFIHFPFFEFPSRFGAIIISPAYKVQEKFHKKYSFVTVLSSSGIVSECGIYTRWNLVLFFPVGVAVTIL
jgi:hypothetical protein